jgi:hypothetical protein
MFDKKGFISFLFIKNRNSIMYTYGTLEKPFLLALIHTRKWQFLDSQ